MKKLLVFLLFISGVGFALTSKSVRKKRCSKVGSISDSGANLNPAH